MARSSAIQWFATALGILAAVAVSSCTPKKASEDSAPAQPVPLKEQGRRIYMANCIACHNPDPTKVGAVGPAVANSSLELLRARVLEGGYPAGYKPKRESKMMAPLPHLKDNLPALEAFLAAP